MTGDTRAKTRNFNSSNAVRAASGLGLVLMTCFAGSASADDVVFGFARGMGGQSSDKARGIAVDASGNVYTTGSFRGTADFDPGPGTTEFKGVGRGDIFISKLDSTGNFLWAKAMIGAYQDAGTGIAVDAAGNVFTAGQFEGIIDFDPGADKAIIVGAGGADVFINKLDSAGNFLWAGAMGGTGYDVCFGMTVDASGNVYTTGYFSDTADFDPGEGTASLTSAGAYDIFISKLDSAGNFVWAKAIGSTSLDSGNCIAVDAAGNVYTSGFFSGTVDFDPGEGTAGLTSEGDNDIFFSKLDSAGNFLWAKAIGGSSFDQCLGIAVDASGNVYATGYFIGTVDFDPGAGTANLTCARSSEIFVSKLDTTGNFVWARAMGAAGSHSRASGIVTDVSGNAYTTGRFVATVDFDPGPGEARLTSTGDLDIFVSKLDTTGNFLWAKAMGGTDFDIATAIGIDVSGNVYTTGNFSGTADFDPGAGTANLTSAGAIDVFVTKLIVADPLAPTAPTSTTSPPR